MCDLIFLLHKIQFIFDSWIILIFILADLKENFDHVLHSLVDIGFVKDVPELIEYCKRDCLVHLFQMLSNFPCQADCNLNTVICRFVEQQ